ncbi:MAG: DUF2851 family protein [Candidatus Kapabacteria bacterium]|nr:DUF2851 family protein [Candidatus Kapabacteria bacterium]
MSDPVRVLRTVRGKRVQILTPGKYNPYEGPDFQGAAILLDSIVCTGAIEFDKHQSAWRQHLHDKQAGYERVVLHAVLISDVDDYSTPEAIVIPADELLLLVDELPATTEPVTLEEVQSYALARLLRLSTEHIPYYKNRSVREGFSVSVCAFIERYRQKRRRPTYANAKLDHIRTCAAYSPHANFLEQMVAGMENAIPARLAQLCTTPIAQEGPQLRMEIMTNCLLPSACVLARDDERIGVFTWYWSAPALCRYGILCREFPLLPQQYVWQQQGMLEMLRLRHHPVSVGSIFRSYGTLVALDFYRTTEEPPLLDDER